MADPVSSKPRSGARSDAPISGVIGRKVLGRYEIEAVLGSGGMASVYLVTDSASGRRLALKQLTVRAAANLQREAAGLFEREFNTLAQLSHPRVIEVYDYGVDTHGPFYTMELLDGGDLRERAPWPWQKACEFAFDVCSSLALLHSRRLLHGDLSPRNVRCTSAGHAKLIDFGAMTPMGRSGQMIGTPAFVAPEVVHRLTLDARTDLFSLGATLYFALTGRLAYGARDFAQILEAWHKKPLPPSSYVAEIPPALDTLVLSLLNLDPSLRPHSVFEVMQRLAAVTGFPLSESVGVSQSYLATPTLVGRAQVLLDVRTHMTRALSGHGGAVLIEGAPGAGRTRVLDACALDAKTLGATVLRGAAAGVQPFTLAQSLFEQMQEAWPELFRSCARQDPTLVPWIESAAESGKRLSPLQSLTTPRGALAQALASLLREVSRQQPLLIAVDDTQRSDEASIALLATLADSAQRSRILVVAAAERSGLERDTEAFSVLAASCRRLPLALLSRPETEQLMGSVFGDVPNLALLSLRVHEVARGNPRECMELLQYLLDRGRVRYAGGNWSLPVELRSDDLPVSADEALRQRLSNLSERASFVAQAQALASHAPFCLDDYAGLCRELDPQQLDATLGELVAQQVLISDGKLYSLVHRSCARLLAESLAGPVLSARHEALATMYEQSARIAMAVKHWLAAQRGERALTLLLPYLASFEDPQVLVYESKLTAFELAAVLERALQLALREGAPPRALADLRHQLVMLSVVTDDAHYLYAAAGWLSDLERDSGLALLRTLPAELPAGERLQTTFARTLESYAATLPEQRVYRPDEAIKLLVRFVAISIAVGTRLLDARLLQQLPGLLEPFAPLSPLIEAIWQNAQAAVDSTCHGKFLQARTRWIGVFERLPAQSAGDLQYVQLIRGAIAFGLGILEARLGFASVTRWVDFLDKDHLQAVSAMYLRKVIRLQYGDMEGAERFRKRAELMAIQASVRTMFQTTLLVELGAHAMTRDVAGLKQLVDRITPLAEQHAGWVSFAQLARGHFERSVGNLEAACEALIESMQEAAPQRTEADAPQFHLAWPVATAAYVETLVELDRAAAARDCAEQALALCRRLDIDVGAHGIVRGLALAESKLGMHEIAAERITALIEEQVGLGVSGMYLGASYEARTRIAIWAGDAAGIENFAQLTAEQYRHGSGSALSARYEQLLEEARRAGVDSLASLAEFQVAGQHSVVMTQRESAESQVAQAMSGAKSAPDRAAIALGMLCEAYGARGGALYLRTANGLLLRATQGPDPCAESVTRFVTQFFAREMDAAEVDTGPLQHTQDASAGAPGTTFVEQSGICFRPVLLAGQLDSRAICAGVIALALDAKVLRSEPRRLASAVAAYLVRVGDVPSAVSSYGVD